MVLIIFIIILGKGIFISDILTMHVSTSNSLSLSFDPPTLPSGTDPSVHFPQADS